MDEDRKAIMKFINDPTRENWEGSSILLALRSQSYHRPEVPGTV